MNNCGRCCAGAALMLGALAAEAEQFRGGYIACVSEELFDEALQAQARKDSNQLKHVLTNGCIVTHAGVKVSVLDHGIAQSKVRAYSGGESIVLWTNTENIAND